MHYLPFNQLPITKSKGFEDEEGDKTRISLFCPFMCDTIGEKIF